MYCQPCPAIAQQQQPGLGLSLSDVLNQIRRGAGSVARAVVGSPARPAGPNIAPPAPSSLSIADIARAAADAAVRAARGQIADTIATQGPRTALGREVAIRSIPQLPPWVLPAAAVGGMVLLAKVVGKRRRRR